MSRLHLALLVSLALHASFFLVRCAESPVTQPLDETLVDLQSEEPLPEIEAPAPQSAPPPPPPPPIQELPPEPADPPPDAPTETVRKPEPSPPVPDAPASPIESPQSSPNSQAQAPSPVTHGSGNSEGSVVGVESLDNKNFKPFGNQKPTYPEVARRMGLEGSATLRILVDSQGKIEKIEVEKWTGHPSFATAASATAQGWRFAPPRFQGKAAKAWYTRTIAFRLHE